MKTISDTYASDTNTNRNDTTTVPKGDVMNAVKRTAALAAALPFACALAAAAPKEAPRKTVVVLVDVSRSIPSADRTKAYRESFANALAAMRAGDRLVLGPLGAADRSSWLSEFDGSYPKGKGFRLADEKAGAEFGKKASTAFETLLERGARSPEGATRVADAVEASSGAFASDPSRSKVLVLLSDMEETGGAPKSRKAPKALEGASVFVSGSGGGRSYSEYESAWRKYFASASGAQVVQYGRFPARLPK